MKVFRHNGMAHLEKLPLLALHPSSLLDSHWSLIACAVLSPGVKSSGAVVKVFRHNDMAHLEKLLRFHIAEGQARTHRPWKKVRGGVVRVYVCIVCVAT